MAGLRGLRDLRGPRCGVPSVLGAEGVLNPWEEEEVVPSLLVAREGMLFPKEAEETQSRQEAGEIPTSEEAEGIPIPWEAGLVVAGAVRSVFQWGMEEANLILKGNQGQWGSEGHCLA